MKYSRWRSAQDRAATRPLPSSIHDAPWQVKYSALPLFRRKSVRQNKELHNLALTGILRGEPFHGIIKFSQDLDWMRDPQQ